MKSTRAPKLSGSFGASVGIHPSRWNESRRSVPSSRWDATSLTDHSPQSVSFAQSAGVRSRNSATRLPLTGPSCAPVVSRLGYLSSQTL